ncbi:MAG: hypothetical protein BGO01_17885 [Armatimonadetes bacterium 55-13]|nr:HAD family hydrolase [Armatimonadota bacterium]OJU64010.1 MAG: hypothetical protein BGO01_17885 [Armatimonadetes bacterium 55-13]
MSLTALVFDFDGLILDTETPEFEAWTTIFQARGHQFPDEWWMHAIGRGADQITETPIDLLQRQMGEPLDHTAIAGEYEHLRMARINSLDALPGVRALIAHSKQNGVRLAVASSSHHRWVDGHLARLGLLDSFEAVLCAGDVPRAKPFPDLYQAACDALGVSPSVALALEDSPNGIRAAKDAGLYCIAIPNPMTSRLDLSHADRIRDSLEGTTFDHLVSSVLDE